MLEDRVIQALCSVLQDLASENINFSQFVNDYCEFYYLLVEESPTSPFEDYLIEKIIYDDNAFSRQSEKMDFDNINESFQNGRKGLNLSAKGYMDKLPGRSRKQRLKGLDSRR